jgi:signal peptidase I
MSDAAVAERESSPWLSVWFQPGRAIERVLAAKPRRYLALWLLVAGASASQFIVSLMGKERAVPLLDWRFLAGCAAVALVSGVVSVWLAAFLLRWSGRMMGGCASVVQTAVVAALGLTPLCAALVIDILFVLALGGATGQVSALVASVPSWIGVVMSIWTMVITIAMLRRVQAFGWWRAIFNYVIATVLTLLVAMLLRTLLLQSFNIPSGAMKPTLTVGDYIFVSKYPYGYSRFSLPFSADLFTGRVLAAEPQRGDVVVFRLPRDTTTDYVKRLVGLPGDRIQMRDGVLYINGTAVRRERVEDFIDDEDKDGAKIRRWRETLPNGVSYETLDLQDNGFLDNTQEYVVPPGHYFMIGDNRDNSTDSRVPRDRGGVGYVPFENLVGRAEIIFFSLNAAAKPPSMRADRPGRVR